jgi:hypothetical protein
MSKESWPLSNQDVIEWVVLMREYFERYPERMFEDVYGLIDRLKSDENGYSQKATMSKMETVQDE